MHNQFIRTFFVAISVFAMLMVKTTSSVAQVVSGKNLIAGKIAEMKQQGVFKNNYNVFSVAANQTDENISKVVTNYTLLTLDRAMVANIISTKPDYMKVNVPFKNGSSFTMFLYKVKISPGEVSVLTSDNSIVPNQDKIVHYRGSIDNDNNSVVSMSFSDNETMSMISNNDGNYVLGKIKNDAAGTFILYNDHHLIPHSDFNCESNTNVPVNNNNGYRLNSSASTTTTTNCVNWYWETDLDIFTDKGSSANVNSYIQGVFNQNATLYANDGVTINLQTVYIWTTTDPYTGPSTGDYLTQFGNYRTTFAGDLAHLIGYNGGGGIAWVNGVCSMPTYETGYSGVSSTYSNVPVFSWTIECISHEEGHLLGSNHTHDCVWNGNNTAIDGCGNAAGYAGSGSCSSGPYPPAGGQGTIMSYCHLNVGINFNLGFGPQPLAVITNRINTASCLSACGSCPVPAQPGTISGTTSVCPSSSQTYSVTAVTGATSYTWTLPSGWSGSSTTNSISVTAGSAAGTISVTANNTCGSSIAKTLAVTISTAVPAQPGTISGSTTVCPSSSQTYSVTAVSGATSYTWTLPSGWSGTSTTNSITAVAGSAGGTISVKANNACGSGTTRTLAVSTGSTAPAQPGAITGNASVCPSSSQTYSVTAVSGATSYTWTLPSGWSGSSTTNSISVTSGITGGTISVTANSSCGNSSARTLALSISLSAPSLPGIISGATTACPSSSQTYSITAVSGATSYIWTLPSGWSGSSTTNSITAVAGSAGGTISVIAVNTCGNSSARTLSVAVGTSAPAQPGFIAGSSSVCPSSSQTYSITAVSGATSYTWTLPSGWSGTSATNSIPATAGSAGGTVTVVATNSCGSSTARTMAVTIGTSAPAQPGSITGSASVCPSSSQTYFVTAVSGATSYTWTLPSGWSGTSATNSITVTAGSAGGTVTVKANNSCGSSATRSLAITIGTSAPSQPGTITGSASVCPSSSQTYSVTAVSGATSYTWTLPSGWSGTSTTNSITAAAGSAGGSITVKANNACGSSAVRTFTVAIGTSAPAQPGTITGSTTVCPTSSQTYSVATVTGATSYTWTLPSGWSGTSATNSITVTAGSAGGTVTVKANNGCGSSATRSLAIAIGTSAPAQPGTITGSTTVCPTSSQTYSVAAVTGATSYTWTLPSGWSGTSTTNSITVTAGSAGGTVTVKANNGCGSSATRSLAIAIGTSAPAQPGTITGSTTVCPSSSQTYSVAVVSGATSYTWTFPSGWSGTSTTNSITVTAGSAGGTVTVKANNGCGSSATRTVSVAIGTSAPSQPGTITGNITVCASSSQTYSVTAVSGATSYTWTLPSGWSGTSTTNSIIVTAGSSAGTVSVRANNGCGSSSSRTLAVTIGTSAPSQPGTIAGNITVCPSSSQTYSITAVTGATSYTWTLPSGWSGTSTTNSITVTAGSAAGTISVRANNACGSSTTRTLSVAIGTSLPSQPGAIVGNTIVCPATLQSYSISSVQGATSYTWSLPSGWTGTSVTNIITVATGSTSGTIAVSANNGCGNSIARTLAVTISASAPGQPGNITGATSVCQNSTQTYSVAAVTGASGYIWSLPPGWSGTSTTNSINVTAGSAPGSITVKANNGCGSSAARTLSLTVLHVLGQPGNIFGSTLVCPNSTETYSITQVPGATSYTWSLPTEWVGNSSNRTIAATSGSTSGIITVAANNGCGSSTVSTINVSANPHLNLSLVEAGNYIVAPSVPAGSTIQWFYQNALVTGSNDSLQNRGAGNYYCVITSSMGCLDTSATLSITSSPTGIEEHSSPVISVYPNPAKDFVQISGVENSNGEVQFTIFNTEGKKVMETKLDASSSKINIKDVASGFYFYKIIDGAAILKSGKLVIVKSDD